METAVILILVLIFIVAVGGPVAYLKLDKNAVQRELDRERNENDKDFKKRLEQKLDQLNVEKGLTKREREIDLLVELEELTTPEIAAKLFLSEHTIKNHKKNIKRKIGSKKRTEKLLQLLLEDYIHGTKSKH